MAQGGTFRTTIGVGANFSEFMSSMQKATGMLQGLQVNLPVVTNTQDLKNAQKQIEQISKKGTIQDVTTKGKIVEDLQTGERLKIATQQLIAMKNAAGATYQEVINIGNGIDPKKFKILGDFKFNENASRNFKEFNNELTKGGKQIEAFGLKAEKWLATATNMTGNEAEAARKTAARLIELDKAFQLAYSTKNYDKMASIVMEGRTLNNQFDIQVAKTKGVAAAFRSWGNVMENAIKQTLAYTFSLGGVRQAVLLVQNAIKFAVDLNKEMIKIQVLGIYGAKTAEEIKNLGFAYTDLAKQLGVTTLEIAKGSVEWLRQGKTINETKKLVEATMMLSKLGALDSAQATEYLTAITNAYKISVEDTVTVVDKLIAVDNIAATSAGELATAMRYTSTTAQQAGVSMDQLISYIGTVSSVTRGSAESIGQAFKTIFSRMQDVKGGFEDGEGSINNVDSSLRKIGITIRDGNTGFRDSATVLEDLSQRWEYLTEVQQNDIAKSVAGIRQRETFLVLMNNMDKALQYQTAELVSTGLAAERYAIYLNGAEGASNRLKASLEELYQTTINSGVIIGVTNLANSVVNLIDAVGGLTPILITAGAAFAVFGNSIIVTKMGDFLNGLERIKLLAKEISITGFKKTFQGSLGTDVTDMAPQLSARNIMIEELRAKLIQLAIAEKTAAESAQFTANAQIKAAIADEIKLGTTSRQQKALLKKALIQKFGQAIMTDEVKQLIKTLPAEEALTAIISLQNKALEENIAALATRDMALQLDSAALGVNTAEESTNALAKKITGLSNGMLVLGAAVAVAMVAWMAYNAYQDFVNEKTKKQVEEFKNLNEEMAKIKSPAFKKLAKEFIDLQKLGGSRNDDEEQRFLEVQKELAALLPESEGGLKAIVDEYGNVRISGVAAYQDIMDAMKRHDAYLNKEHKKSMEGLFAPAPTATTAPTQQYGSYYGVTAPQQASPAQPTPGGSMGLYSGTYAPPPSNGLLPGQQSVGRRMVYEAAGMTEDQIKSFIGAPGDFKNAIESGGYKEEIQTAMNTLFAQTDSKESEENFIKNFNYDFADLSKDMRDTIIKNAQDNKVAVAQQEVIAQTAREAALAATPGAKDIESFVNGATTIKNYTDMVKELGDIGSKYGNEPIQLSDLNPEDLMKLQESYPQILDGIMANQDGTKTLNDLIADQTELRKANMVAGIREQIELAKENNAEAQKVIDENTGIINSLAGATRTLTEEEQLELDTAISRTAAAKDAIITNDALIASDTIVLGVVQNLTTATADLTAGIDALVGKISSAKSAIDEYNSTGSLSIQTALNMIKAGDADSLSIDTNTGRIILNTSALQANLLAQIQTQIGLAQTAYQAALDARAVDGNTISVLNNIKARKAQLDILNILYKQVSAGDFNLGVPAGGGGGGETPEQAAAKKRIKNLEEEKKKLQDRLNEYKKYISLKKEELKLQKEEAKFIDELAKKNKSLAKLKTRIVLLSLDDSEEARAQRLQAEEEATALEEEITTTSEDRKYDLQVQALDDMSAKFEESINKQIEALDKQIEKLNEVAQATQGSGNGYVDLGDKGVTAADKIINALEGIGLATQDQRAYLEDYINYLLNAGRDVEEVGQIAANAWAWMQAVANMTPALQASLDMRNRTGHTANDTTFTPSGHTGGIVGKTEIKHEGGFVGNLRSNETFAKLLQGEYVATENQMNDFMKNVLPKIAGSIPTSSGEKIGGNINISMPINVEGNMDKDVIPDLEKIIQKTIKELNNNMKNRGYIRPTTLTSI